MGKAPARDYGLATTRSRRASAASIESYTNKKLACGECLKTFGRKGDLKRHELLHRGVKNHKCHLCEKRFSQNSGLKTHLNTHTGKKPYQCEYEDCKAEFGDPSSHARHRKETHEVNYRYKCPADKCISAIKRRSAFTAHLKAKHNIVASSKQLDDLRKGFKPAPGQRRKANQVDLTRASALAIAESINPIHRNRSVTPPDLSPTAKLEQILSARGVLHQQKPGETQFYFHPDQSHQTDVQSLFSPPMLSSSTMLSAFSAQSSTETLVDDFKYEDYTHVKMFYADVVDHSQSFNLAVDVTPSSSPSLITPKASPFAKDVYTPSPPSMHPGPQDYLRMTTQMAYDRQRYIPNTGGSSTSYPFGYKSYIMSQVQEKNPGYSYPQLDLVQQTLPQSWQPWSS